MISRFNKVLISDCLFDSNTTNGDPTISGGAAIYIEWASPIITNNTFSNYNGITDGAILCTFTSNAIISYNVFSNNKGRYGSILCGNSYDNKPIISGNIFSDNVATTSGGGIFAMYSKALITDNLFFHNYSQEGGGIKFYYNDKSVCINNTIAYNSSPYGGGIALRDNSDPILINSIIYGNSGSFGNVCISDAQSDPHFFFCNIQGGNEGFRGSGSGANYTGLYENNIDANPSFKDTASSDYSLSISSLCIGAGIDSLEVAGFWYYVSPFCIMGNPRPSPSGTMPDIGACENLLGSPLVGVEQELTNPTEFFLYQNYPNPFNPTTTIKYSITMENPLLGGARGESVTLKIYDVLGNEVATLVNEEKPAGIYEIIWDAEKLSSGVYYYQLKAGDFTSTKRLLLLK